MTEKLDKKVDKKIDKKVGKNSRQKSIHYRNTIYYHNNIHYRNIIHYPFPLTQTTLYTECSKALPPF